jgi:hypothetical protein
MNWFSSAIPTVFWTVHMRLETTGAWSCVTKEMLVNKHRDNTAPTADHEPNYGMFLDLG